MACCLGCEKQVFERQPVDEVVVYNLSFGYFIVCQECCSRLSPDEINMMRQQFRKEVISDGSNS